MATREKSRGNKEAKKNHGKEEWFGKDRLSDLPDSILLHIFSFLPEIRFCVRTSLLSKRWSNLWASLPDIFFDKREGGRAPWFKKLVRNVLSRRENLPLNKFSFRYGKDKSLFTSIIKYAMSHNVQHFSIFTQSASLTYFYPQFNSSRSLKTLELTYFNDMHLLEDFTLPNLTTLYLYACNFGYNGDEPTSIDPFGGFLNLKSLQLHYCSLGRDGVRNFKISGFQLDSLAITDSGPCKVEIVAPKLRILCLENLDGSGTMKFSDLYLPLLEVADIDVFVLFVSKELREKSLLDLINMFSRLFHLQTLVTSYIIEGLMEFPGLLEDQASPFVRLKTLRVKCESISSFTIPDNAMNFFGQNITLEKIKDQRVRYWL